MVIIIIITNNNKIITDLKAIDNCEQPIEEKKFIRSRRCKHTREKSVHKREDKS